MDVLEYNVYQGQATNSWFQSANDLSLSLRVVNMGSCTRGAYGPNNREER